MEIKRLDFTEIDCIEPLWRALIAHNAKNSTHFSAYFQTFSFDIRKAFLQEKIDEGENFDLLLLPDAGGFCAITYDEKNGSGEIEMLYVAPENRGKGYGDTLMREALRIFAEKNIGYISLDVAQGNEAALRFYAKYDLLPFTVKAVKIC